MINQNSNKFSVELRVIFARSYELRALFDAIIIVGTIRVRLKFCYSFLDNFPLITFLTIKIRASSFVSIRIQNVSNTNRCTARAIAVEFNLCHEKTKAFMLE